MGQFGPSFPGCDPDGSLSHRGRSVYLTSTSGNQPPPAHPPGTKRGSRKQRPAANHNNERWLVSYADFVTLLFALFVVLFVYAEVDQDRAERVSRSVSVALYRGSVPGALARMTGAGDPEAKQETLRGAPGSSSGTRMEGTTDALLLQLMPTMQYLVGQLGAEIAAGDLHVVMERRGLVVSMAESALFASGEDAIPAASYPLIGKIATAIRQIPNQVRVEGHTDSVPIYNERFQSNWDLSAARSIAVLNLLVDRYRIPHERLSIAAYAANAPVASNRNEDGRARNRRVDLVILNEFGMESEPAMVTPEFVEEASGPRMPGSPL